MSRKSTRNAARDERMSYEESKRLARDQDPSVRADLAVREDLRPEILYYLAEDASPEVRCRIAANRQTPRQADLVLARDGYEPVRHKLAHKIKILMPDLAPDAQEQVQRYLIEVIEILAQDQAVRVRQVVADTLKDVALAPPHVIQRLARDAAVVVACPVLEFSPLLSDQDLVEIIENGCVVGKLNAISRRHGVGERVTDAIADTRDVAAVTALLDNDSAQIREETLDGLVDAALQVSAWHEPLVRRPALSFAAVRKLAGFVAESLLNILEAREDLDKKMKQVVAMEVRRRLDSDDEEKEAKTASPEDRAKRLMAQGELGEEALGRALNAGDRDLVRHGLALRAKLPVTLVDHILAARSAKGVTALAWKAECSMRFASQLQLRMGGIPHGQVLNARAGTEYPLTAEEMAWQIDFFQSLSGGS
jgi:uncharacterized protein (DUF2336 family)